VCALSAGIIDAVSDLRNWFIHPGAFVRDGAVHPSEGMAGLFLIILQAAEFRLGEVMTALPEPPA
jgi:hypothetical protein